VHLQMNEPQPPFALSQTPRFYIPVLFEFHLQIFTFQWLQNS
jgi:hypothetical protein